MRAFVDTHKTKQMNERETIREGRNKRRNNESFKLTNTENVIPSKERSYTQISYSSQQRQNNDRPQSDAYKHYNSRNTNTTIHSDTPRFSEISKRRIPNNSLFGVQSKNKDLNNKKTSLKNPNYDLSEDYELGNEIFNYELSLGNEKWEDVLPQLSKSPFAAHSRLLYPAPLLCDVTRQFKMRASSKKRNI